MVVPQNTCLYWPLVGTDCKLSCCCAAELLLNGSAEAGLEAF